MNDAWIIFSICIIVVLGAALPLIRSRDQNPPPPPKPTLRDWRKDQ